MQVLHYSASNTITRLKYIDFRSGLPLFIFQSHRMTGVGGRPEVIIEGTNNLNTDNWKVCVCVSGEHEYTGVGIYRCSIVEICTCSFSYQSNAILRCTQCYVGESWVKFDSMQGLSVGVLWAYLVSNRVL